MKLLSLTAFTVTLTILGSGAQAVPMFSSPECMVKGIIKDQQQRVEKVEDGTKVFNDATLFVLEQDFSNEYEKETSSLTKMSNSCNAKFQDMVYQLRDDFVTFKDTNLEKKLEGQCVQGHAKLSDIDNTLGIWLYDVEVLSPEECMITASE